MTIARTGYFTSLALGLRPSALPLNRRKDTLLPRGSDVRGAPMGSNTLSQKSGCLYQCIGRDFSLGDTDQLGSSVTNHECLALSEGAKEVGSTRNRCSAVALPRPVGPSSLSICVVIAYA